MLGLNDLGWFVTDVNGTLRNLETFVSQARAAKPTIKFLIAHIIDRTFIGAREDLVSKTKEYNARLPQVLLNWVMMGNYQSKLSLVDGNSAYKCRPDGCPDDYEGLHPNADGQRSIAGAFAAIIKTVVTC